jgi:predicted DsbA family dithiol-disulfide isomerase
MIDIYSSIECPFAYLAVYRLRRVWPEYAGRVEIAWRALSLEYINGRGPSRPVIELELDLFRQMEPGLPVQGWSRSGWEWPVTMWPAFEALACVQAQSADAGMAMSWALRHAFFAESRNITLRGELLAIAQEIAAEVSLDLQRFEADWDGGRYKGTVIADSRHGWHDLKVSGSPTCVLPDGRQVSDLATGDIDIDEERAVLLHHTPFEGDPLAVFRRLLDSAV